MDIIREVKKEVSKTGRAYSGEIRKFASTLFRAAVNVSRQREKTYIVATSVSYDFFAEETYFGRLAQADKTKKSGNPLISFVERLYYTFLESHFFYNLYSLIKAIFT